MAAKQRITSRVYIVPTWVGLAFATVILVITTVAAFQLASLVFLLAFFLMIAGMLSMVQTNANLGGVEIISVQAPLTAVGKPIRVTIQLRNFTKQPRYHIRIEFRGPWREAKPIVIPVLAPLEHTSLTLEHPALTRGSHRLPNLRLSSTFPLGTCFAWRMVKVEAEVLIYPAPVGDQSLPEAFSTEIAVGAPTISALGEEFVGHRAFRPADSHRRVDWRARARGLPLMVKTFGADFSKSYQLDITRVERGDLESKLNQLSAWVELVKATNQPFSLTLDDASPIPLGQGKAHAEIALAKLARYGERVVLE